MMSNAKQVAVAVAVAVCLLSLPHFACLLVNLGSVKLTGIHTQLTALSPCGVEWLPRC